MTTSAQDLVQQLQALQAQALQELAAARDAEAVEQWRIMYLGRKEGRLTSLLRRLPSLPPQERPQVGAEANQVKQALDGQLAQKLDELKQLAQRGAQGGLDITLPGRPVVLGRLHPTTRIWQEIAAAFISMGFEVAEGPEVEWDRYNFELLNIPKGHPARDMFDTLWIDYVDQRGERPMLLRTHTSPMQARIMEQRVPPIRVIVPGKVYRYEATDATHEWHFHQVEGLAVDEGITMAHLKGTLYEFARRVFGPERRVRFRCDYFPFVEPGVDMAIDCFLCGGKGCRVCKGSGWIEIMGAGMVHPKVLEGVGYDSQRFTGFAFGIGMERAAMLKWGIEDIRLFYANDLRFLRQF